jgi:hypothetical protein
MINLEVDDQELKKIFREKLDQKINELDTDLIFWDRKELMRRTCLSWNNIQEKFFFDPRFPKYKVGQKWIFPAQKTKDFLLQWITEQRTN